MQLQLDVDFDSITIENQVVRRPNHISRHNWHKYWSNLKLSFDVDRDEVHLRTHLEEMREILPIV